MKTLKYIFVIVIALIFVNNTFAQKVEYPTHKCKYFKNVLDNPSEWKVINESGDVAPIDNMDATFHQIAEKCQDWYISGELGVAARETKFSPNFRGFVALGYDFCLGQHNNFGIGIEAKFGTEKFHEQTYDGGLTTIRGGYMPMIGGNLLLHFSQHKKARVSLVLGGSYARLTSDYATPQDGVYLKNIAHNTSNLEGALQVLLPIKYGFQMGVKAGYSFTHTNHLQQGQMFVGVVIKLKRVYKSKTTSYREAIEVNDQVNKMRQTQSMDTQSR